LEEFRTENSSNAHALRAGLKLAEGKGQSATLFVELFAGFQKW